MKWKIHVSFPHIGEDPWSNIVDCGQFQYVSFLIWRRFIKQPASEINEKPKYPGCAFPGHEKPVLIHGKFAVRLVVDILLLLKLFDQIISVRSKRRFKKMFTPLSTYHRRRRPAKPAGRGSSNRARSIWSSWQQEPTGTDGVQALRASWKREASHRHTEHLRGFFCALRFIKKIDDGKARESKVIHAQCWFHASCNSMWCDADLDHFRRLIFVPRSLNDSTIRTSKFRKMVMIGHASSFCVFSCVRR